MNEQAYGTTPWTWRDRVRWKLFPSRWCQTPAAPAHFEDVLFVNTTCVLDVVDRVRVLITGRLRVETRVVCEHKPGATVSASACYVTWPSPEESKRAAGPSGDRPQGSEQ